MNLCAPRPCARMSTMIGRVGDDVDRAIPGAVKVRCNKLPGAVSIRY